MGMCWFQSFERSLNPAPRISPWQCHLAYGHILIPAFLFAFVSTFLCLFIYICMYICMCLWIADKLRKLVLSCHMWVLEINLRKSSLVASTNVPEHLTRPDVSLHYWPPHPSLSHGGFPKQAYNKYPDIYVFLFPLSYVLPKTDINAQSRQTQTRTCLLPLRPKTCNDLI